MAISNDAMSRIHKSAYVGGAILCVASLGFVIWAFNSQVDRIGELDLLELQLGPLALAAGLYLASLITTAIAWPLLVGSPRQSFGRLVIVGLASQVAKYVPGNFANYLGRALIAQRHAIGLTRGMANTVVEIGSAIVAGMIVGIFSISESEAALGVVSRHAPQLRILSLGVLMIFVLFACKGRSPLLLAGSTMTFMVSFVLAGASFYAVSLAFVGQLPLEATFAVAAYAFAWIAGFVVVGAPAGLGVREAILVGLLAPVIGAQFAVVLAALHRLVTIGVDLIMGVAANYVLWGRIGPTRNV